MVVGANGVITFNTTNANAYCSWSFTQSLPSASLFTNTIFGAYHDIDPSVCGSFRYGVVGSYPCRAFIMNFDQVCHFSCNSIKSTLQVVLYEGTNIIEVHILSKPTCSSWNSGNCLIGIQNATGTVAFVPPGRNTGPWSTSNEAWRFTPNGAPAYTISWFNGSSVLGYTQQVNVNVNQADTFIAVATYENCIGAQLVFLDTVIVYMSGQGVSITTSDSVLCAGESTVLNISGGDAYLWSDGSTGTSLSITPASSGYYSVTATYLGTCEAVDSIYIEVNPNPNVSIVSTDVGICTGETASLTASGALDYSWSNGILIATQDVSPLSTTTYTVTGTDANGCTDDDSFTLQVYETPQIVLNVMPEEGCEPLFVQFSPTVVPAAATYQWIFGDPASGSQNTSSNANPSHTFHSAGSYDISLEVTSADGCSNSVLMPAKIQVYPLPISEFTADSLVVNIDNPLVTFTDFSVGANSWYWNFGDFSSMSNVSFEQNPSHSFSSEGTYFVHQTAITDHGCRDSSFQIIEVQRDISFFVPNTFTPFNGDGLNDVFRPYGIGVNWDNYSMRIFNRWGKQIFYTEDVEYGWDGKIGGNLAEPGVYSYIIELQFADGLWQTFTGKIMLLQ